jgi:DNA-directed RNA polymerase specialized sigma24 family protein
MSRTFLHLVDFQGRYLSSIQRDAVEAAYRWAIREFPRLDQARLANWAEQVGASLAKREETIESPRRYAFAALHGKIREHFRSGGANQIAVGISHELEKWAGLDMKTARQIERTVLFGQLSTRLSERDRFILVLLLQDVTSPAKVAVALGVSYSAAAKAIQRVKDRISTMLVDKSSGHESKGSSLRSSEN